MKKIFNNKKLLLVLIIGILLIGTLIIGTSYALWLSNVSQRGKNIVANDCFKLTYTDKNEINLENAMPIKEVDSLSLIPYEFTIKNICKTGVDYSVNIETIAPTSILSQFVRIKIDDDSSSILSNFNSNTTKVIDSSYEARTIKTGILLENESVTYSLKIWIDENATTEQVEGKSFAAKVTVSGYVSNFNTSIALHPNGGDLTTSRILATLGEAIGTIPTPLKNDYALEGWYSDEELTNLITSETIVTNDLTDLYAKYIKESVAPPELYQGLTAIKYSDTNNDGVKDIVVADTSSSWYNYNNHEWANAAILDSSKTYTVGQTINEADVLQMYVWIPRFRYQLWNTENENSNEQMINIFFENKNTVKSEGTANDEWLTHPAFTLGETELNGIWVGKFDTSYYKNNSSYVQENLNCTSENCDSAKYLRIKPNVISLFGNNVSSQFYASRSIENMSEFNLKSRSIDTHMMKNIEWGAVAYLSASKYGLYSSDVNSCHNDANTSESGCEVWANVSTSSVTGCSGTELNAGSSSTCQSWNDATYGGNSSTTGNVYGIYDMSGNWEYVMGNVTYGTYDFMSNGSGFTSKPEDKYIDMYYANSGSYNIINGKLGDATRETMKNISSTSGGWYNDYVVFPSSGWFTRGGATSMGTYNGLFGTYSYGGSADSVAFRVVMTADMYDKSINLHLNGGTLNESTYLIKSSGKIGALPNPTRDGFVFDGWYSDERLENVVTSDTEVTADLTDIYAKWITEPSASAPELYQGLTAIKFEDKDSDGTKDIVVADTSSSWYNYSNHEWANAAILDSSKTYTVGQVVNENDILQMYVWVPRYKYKLWNTVNETSNEQMIEVVFEDKNTTKSAGSTNGEWLTHPAFTFGNTELNGIWVGKFETAYYKDNSGYSQNSLNCTDESCLNAEYIRIKPNVPSTMGNYASNQFYAARSMEKYFGLNSSVVDTHAIKNMEWGAVAYLSASKYGLYNADGATCHNNANTTGSGCEIWINPVSTNITGCSGTTLDSSQTAACQVWNDQTYGGNSSTTGNLYGIYDMSGNIEYVMASIKNSDSGDYYFTSSGFSEVPNSKYFDLYKNTSYNSYAFDDGKLGDATREIVKVKNNSSGGWYNDYLYVSGYNWLTRSGYYAMGSYAGIFGYYAISSSSSAAMRIVITAEDNQ